MSNNTSKIENLVTAAKRWASFQEEDSQIDQQTDTMLYAEAHRAEQELLEAIQALPDATAVTDNQKLVADLKDAVRTLWDGCDTHRHYDDHIRKLLSTPV